MLIKVFLPMAPSSSGAVYNNGYGDFAPIYTKRITSMPSTPSTEIDAYESKDIFSRTAFDDSVPLER